MLSRLIALASLVLALLGPGSVAGVGAQTAPHCASAEAPAFVFGFANLKAELGAPMGDPVSCEYPDPRGTGDTLQDTSTGLAFWRQATNVPTFTTGASHWALSEAGLVTWTG